MISVEEARKNSRDTLEKRTPRLYKIISKEIKYASKQGQFSTVISISEYFENDVISAVDELRAMGYDCEKTNSNLFINWNPAKKLLNPRDVFLKNVYKGEKK